MNNETEIQHLEYVIEILKDDLTRTIGIYKWCLEHAIFRLENKLDELENQENER